MGMGPNNYQLWDMKIGYLENELLKKESLLRQYALWLETSEENTIHKGKDVCHMLVGVLQGLTNDGIDFIPGTGWENFVAVVSRVQKETGLDLGVCQFLENNIRERKRSEYLGENSEKTFSECKATMGMKILIGSLEICLPPKRCECQYRKNMLEQKVEL